MPTFSAYCKAYTLAQLRTYPDWREPEPAPMREMPAEDAEGEPQHCPLTDADYVFLHDTFVVTEGIFADEHVIFAEVTPAWRAFCHDTLGFSEQGVPDAAAHGERS